MSDLSDPQMGELRMPAERAALFAELAMLHAEKSAVETAIQRVQARLDGRVQDWRELVDFTQAAQR